MRCWALGLRAQARLLAAMMAAPKFIVLRRPTRSLDQPASTEPTRPPSRAKLTIALISPTEASSESSMKMRAGAMMDMEKPTVKFTKQATSVSR